MPVFTLEITQADIDKATHKRDNDKKNYILCRECVVAEAMQRTFGATFGVGFGSATMVFENRDKLVEGKYYKFTFGQDLCSYIRDFDEKIPVEPATFELKAHELVWHPA